MVDEYDAVLLHKDDEITNYIVHHCLQKKTPVYFAKEGPLLYGVNKIRNNGMNYILILGNETEGESLFDRIRAYLM